MNQINNLKDKIQNLISRATEKNEKQKEVLNFLFGKLEEVKELETLEKLQEFEKGKYLRAYLFYQSIKRANYQIEHLKLTHLDDTDKYLEAIARDIEILENGEKEKKPTISQPTNEQLLIMLGGRIKTGEIKGDWEKWSKLEDEILFSRLFVKNGKGQEILSVDLETGKIEPDPAEDFLKKHGLVEVSKIKTYGRKK